MMHLYRLVELELCGKITSLMPYVQKNKMILTSLHRVQVFFRFAPKSLRPSVERPPVESFSTAHSHQM